MERNLWLFIYILKIFALVKNIYIDTSIYLFFGFVIFCGFLLHILLKTAFHRSISTPLLDRFFFKIQPSTSSRYVVLGLAPQKTYFSHTNSSCFCLKYQISQKGGGVTSINVNVQYTCTMQYALINVNQSLQNQTKQHFFLK